MVNAAYYFGFFEEVGYALLSLEGRLPSGGKEYKESHVSMICGQTE